MPYLCSRNLQWIFFFSFRVKHELIMLYITWWPHYQSNLDPFHLCLVTTWHLPFSEHIKLAVSSVENSLPQTAMWLLSLATGSQRLMSLLSCCWISEVFPGLYSDCPHPALFYSVKIYYHLSYIFIYTYFFHVASLSPFSQNIILL